MPTPSSSRPDCPVSFQLIPSQPCSLDELIARADAAMYDCKRRKRNRRTP